MSKVVVFTTYGDPDVLHAIEVEHAQPGPGHVRVHVHAAGVQPFDCLFRSGAARQWLPARFPQRLGNEFAGVVEAVGEDVGEFSVGDEVLGWAMLASYAEHVVVGVDDIVRKPQRMDWAEAGALSASGQTAATALTDLALSSGETLLVNGAAGGVGTFAVQLAVASGATVIGTASKSNHDHLRSLGAIPLEYGDDLVRAVHAVAPDGVDAALDLSGTGPALHASVQLVTDKQRIGTTAFTPTAAQLGIRRLSTDRSAALLHRLTDL